MQDLKAFTNRRTPRYPKSRTRLLRKEGGSAVIADPGKRRTHSVSPLSKPFWTRLFVTGDPVESRHLIRGLMLTLSSTLLMAAVGWMVWGTALVAIPYFQQPLKNIRIHGLNRLTEQELLGGVGLKPGEALLNIDPYELATRLRAHPLVREVDLRRQFPHRLHLNIQEHQPVARLQAANEVFLIDAEQRVLQRIVSGRFSAEDAHLILVTGLRTQALQPGMQLQSSVLAQGLEILQELAEMPQATRTALRVDLSEPQNLKLVVSVDGRRKPLEVQLGRVGFANRVEQFRKLYPLLLGTLKKPQMVDLRHPDRVSLLQ